MMTPVYLNPPSSPFSLGEQAEDQRLKLFISSPYDQAASSSYSRLFPTFFADRHSSLEDQTLGSTSTATALAHDHHKAKAIWRGYDQACSSSSSSLVQAAHVVDVQSNKDHKLSISPCTSNHERQINGGDHEGGKSNYIGNSTRPRAVKWMSSKMRLMQKMTNNPTHHHIPADQKLTGHKLQISEHQESSETSHSNNNNTAAAVRVCSDCNTNTTPLWRSGPRGPKSLCNACGIRQRKARRVMAEAAEAAANGFVVGSNDSTPSPKGKVANKEKKSRGSHSKNKSKLIITDTSISHNNSTTNNICFKGLAFQGVFPQDVAQAAILLMELSSGLINYSS